MVDPVRLARLLQRTGEQLSRLEGWAGDDRAALRRDEIRLAAVKYAFVTVLEGVLDVAHHLLASELWGPAESGADAVRLLGRHGVLDAATASGLARAVGFRNLLVHGYAEVDDDRVVAALDRADELRSFLEQVRAWAASHC